MKTFKNLLAVVALLCATSLTVLAQQQQQVNKVRGYEFTTVKANPITGIRNQGSSGTCWAFSTTSFFESEAIRNGHADTSINLSVMYSVTKNYIEKMRKFIRMDGYLNFAEGGSFEDVRHSFEDYGVVLEKDMPNLLPGEKRINFREMTAISNGMAEGAKKAGGKVSPRFMEIYKSILETYLGKCPETTTYKGITYTPKDFVTKGLGLNMDDYVSITSFTHHPFYTTFAIEVPDNWRWDLSYNIPLDELIQIMDNAIENGYTIAWGSDVSETGFTRDGIGVVPDVEANEKNFVGSDQARWVGTDPNARRAQINNLNEPGKELTITQQMRQEGYDNKTTTDDHGMQIFGIAKDQNGTKYYMVKNSWGPAGKYKGVWYVSEAFVRYKTMNILVNKNSIPKAIRKKMGL